MKKILLILTNVDHYGDDKEKTGLWLAEAAEFVYDVTRAGYQVDYASAKGGNVPLDPRSLKKRYRSRIVDDVLESADFKERALSNSLAIEAVNPNDYIAIYFTGGHGVLWDFPDNIHFNQVANDIYQNGGYVMSICHGLAGLVRLKLDDHSYLISGKTVTGFTNIEEVFSGKLRKVPFLTETEARKTGAYFVQKFPFFGHAVKDGKIITGQNPMSGHQVARLFLESEENL